MGEHSTEVLRELGYSEEEIESLIKTAAVVTAAASPTEG
jgi:crotonobetainyl-CoA:carnitine CoA-transferase CaiB-like acyl-CoA transferase